MTEAVKAAIRLHRALGNPIAVWRNDRVVWLQPDELTDETLST